MGGEDGGLGGSCRLQSPMCGSGGGAGCLKESYLLTCCSIKDFFFFFTMSSRDSYHSLNRKT